MGRNKYLERRSEITSKFKDQEMFMVNDYARQVLESLTYNPNSEYRIIEELLRIIQQKNKEIFELHKDKPIQYTISIDQANKTNYNV